MARDLTCVQSGCTRPIQRRHREGMSVCRCRRSFTIKQCTGVTENGDSEIATEKLKGTW